VSTVSALNSANHTLVIVLLSESIVLLVSVSAQANVTVLTSAQTSIQSSLVSSAVVNAAVILSNVALLLCVCLAEVFAATSVFADTFASV